jgi:hypothetical protein
VWRAIIVRLAACSEPAGRADQRAAGEEDLVGHREAGSIAMPQRLSRVMPTITRQTRISTTIADG